MEAVALSPSPDLGGLALAEAWPSAGKRTRREMAFGLCLFGQPLCSAYINSESFTITLESSLPEIYFFFSVTFSN